MFVNKERMGTMMMMMNMMTISRPLLTEATQAK
jgi:hypothetical protein